MFVVVLSILIVVSITQKGPIIFLRLAEKTAGEYDGVFTNLNVDFKGFNDFTYDEGYYLNYTEAQSITD